MAPNSDDVTRQAFFLSADAWPRPLNVLGDQITVLASAARTGGMELFRQQAEAGQGPPPHSHAWDETFYVVVGEVDIVAGDISQRLGPGGVAHVPGGVVHSFRFVTDCEVISLTSHPGASQLFAAIDAANPSGPPDMDAVVEAIERNGAKLAF